MYNGAGSEEGQKGTVCGCVLVYPKRPYSRLFEKDKEERTGKKKKTYDAKEGGSLYSTFKEALSNPYRSPQPLLERLQQLTVEMNVIHLQ